ncbi:MFS transporter [Thermococcus sp.]
MKRERTILQGHREKVGKLKQLRAKRRNVLLLALSMFPANVSFGMAFPYMSVYMRLLGGTMLMVGLLSVAFNLTSTAFQYPFGYLSDSTRNRKGFIALGLFFTGLFYALMSLVSTPLALLALRTSQGALGSAMMPAKSALIAELSTRIGPAYGVFSTVENAGYMAGNFLGGFLVKRIGIRGIFVLSGVLLVVSTMIALAMREKPGPKRAPRLLLIPQEGRESDRTTVGKKALGRLMRDHLGIFYLSVLLMIASGQVYSVVSVYFSETFGDEWVGILFGIDSIAAALSGYYIGKLIDRYGAKRFYPTAFKQSKPLNILPSNKASERAP